MIGQYDVVFVERKENNELLTRVLAQNVSQMEASRLAARYCYRGGLEDGVRVVHHGTMKQAVESCLWQ